MRRQKWQPLWKVTAAFLCLFLLFASSCEKAIPIDERTEPTEEESQTEPITQTEPPSWTEFIQQDDELDPIALRGAKNIEDVFVLDIQGVLWNNDNLMTAYLETENDVALSIKTYLQGRGTYKETPDRVDKIDQVYRIEQYTNSKGDKTSYIIVIPIETVEKGRMYELFCFTYAHEDFKKIGSIAYDKTHESLYDAEENLVASISYEYLEGIPFAFINGFSGAKQYADFDTHRGCGDFFVLNRSNKFWLYKDLAVFAGTRVTRYDGLETGRTSYKKEPFSGSDYLMKEFIYDKKGRLEKIQEKFPKDYLEEHGYDPGELRSEITLDYRNDDTLKMLDYSFSWSGYGTYDCTGEIYYDKLERMEYMHYYVTHGRHHRFFLYEGESARPWAFISFCTFGGGLDNFYLFKQR